MRHSSRTQRSPGGFTLVELLVVIAIIGILVALTAVAVSGVTNSQRRANTISSMTTVYQALQAHWAQVVADAKKETGLDAPFQQMNSLFGQDNTGGERNRIIWIKMRLMEAFPVSYAEIHNPFPYSSSIIPTNMRKYNGTYVTVLGKLASDKSNNNPYPPHYTESAACLLLALSISRGGVAALNLDTLGNSNVADTDGDGIMELIDNWGKPLVFYRFPTPAYSNTYPNSTLLQSSNPSANNPSASSNKYADPLDPSGVLYNWVGGQQTPNMFTNNVHSIVSSFPNSPAFYVIPTIVSSGPDGNLGLDNGFKLPKPTMSITSPKDAADEADNIYSFSLRSGAGQGKLQ
jgi:prepilin-type N-terminal cleavage/methylation domain-containing protein